VPKKAVSVEFDAKTVVFPTFQRMQTQNLAIDFMDGDPNEYPFDTYSFSQFYVRAYSDNVSIPIGMSLGGSLQGFTE
jgi:Domain of unknown function (DUF4436)